MIEVGKQYLVSIVRCRCAQCLRHQGKVVTVKEEHPFIEGTWRVTGTKHTFYSADLEPIEMENV